MISQPPFLDTTTVLLNITPIWGKYTNKEFSQTVGHCLTQIWNEFTPFDTDPDVVVDYLSHFELINITTLLKDKNPNPLNNDTVLAKKGAYLFEKYGNLGQIDLWPLSSVVKEDWTFVRLRFSTQPKPLATTLPIRQLISPWMPRRLSVNNINKRDSI